MNHIWKKGIATAVLGIAILTQTHAANAQAMYKANEEDTFWKLSNKFGVTVNSLMQANPFVDAANIYEGLQLVIPDSAHAASARVEGPIATKEKPAAAKKMEAVKPAPKAVAAEAKSPEAPKAAKKVAKTAVKTTAKQTKKTASKQAQAKTAKRVAAKKPELDHVSVNGKSYVYTDVMQVKASAYTAAASENGWGPVDYFGNPLKLGTIAVDPDVIPMGSKVYITGYDYNGLPSGGMMAVATDQGSAINGNRIDIFVPQSQKSASAFGFQNVKVFILN
ncbi:LysM peptidoglycan-binding domain-containing protein [Paenibacillus rhizovicinus]|uniref:LysM peptidoglycan-binding domain-containing protein n=1 Tax=Paenibacillus rhizovicinus TaxID=2704463 RepID=A0A6C0NX75_9BACL|nr:3D domain-containing protein [Paenibacillus rhizovicinus]QHW30778.1 LysM peptidoglycan-binding domain-containing protein [Paenibacillus rhizovicinus]